jgi:hypothetical protein
MFCFLVSDSIYFFSIDPVLLELSLEQMRVFLQTDPRLYTPYELKEKAKELQTLGEFLLEEFQYKNEEKVGFFIKRTSERCKALGCVKFPFRDCSEDRAHCTNCYGSQKHYYSAKDKSSPAYLVIDEYYFGPKLKSSALPSVFSLLAIQPTRKKNRQPSRKENRRKKPRKSLLLMQSNSLPSVAHLDRDVPPSMDSPFSPSPAQSDAEFDFSMFLAQ